MKLRNVLLSSGLVVFSCLGLASCNSEVSLKGEYQNLDGEVTEVEIKKTSDQEAVLDTLKYLAYKGENTAVDINIASINMKMHMDGSISSSKYNADLTTKLIANLYDNDFSIKVGGKISAAGKSQDMNMGIYCDGNYLYYNYMNQKYRLSAQALDSEYSEMLDKLKEIYDESNLKSAFDFIGIKQNNGKSAFETIMDNETAVKDYISATNLTVSSVTNDYIYLTYNLNGDAILRYCKENDQAINGLDSINFISEDDKMIFVIGYDTTYYYPSYININFNEATSVLNAIGENTISINSYTLEMWYSVNKDTVSKPSNLNEYSSYGF